MSYYDFLFDENSNENANEGFVPNFVDNSVTPDLNTPLEEPYGNQYSDPYAQQRQKFAEFGNQYKEYSASYENFNIPPVPVEDSYTQQGNSCYGDGGYENGVKQDYTEQEYSSYRYCGEADDAQQDYSKEGDGVDGLYPVIVSFQTNLKFSTREEITSWVKNRGRPYDYLFSIKRSKRNSVWFQCSFGGEFKSVATVRNTGSKKTNCPFELKARYLPKQGVWTLEVIEEAHNHTPIENFEGHATARRLDADDMDMIAKMAEQGISKHNMWLALTNKNPNRPIIVKDVHNAVQKLNAQKRVGNTTMQKLEIALVERKFTYYTSDNQTTNAVENIFFAHPNSFTMWCAYPHVLVIDATYKTNIYNLPFVQIVGMTSTNQTFCIAHAFISAEKVENYVWLLEKLKSILEPGMEPCVIVTDRELALMAACNKVFPGATNNLCRFHVSLNINRNLPKDIEKKVRDGITHRFFRLCESPSKDIYRYNLDKYENYMKSIHFSKVFAYIKDSWMDPYSEKLVSAWTYKSINFHQNTTNRVEGTHAQFKSLLKGHPNSLLELVLFVEQLVDKQYMAIKHKFEESLRKQFNDHKSQPLVEGLCKNVSIYAINLVMVEINRLENWSMRYGGACGCQLFTSCGLPCVCRIAEIDRKGQQISLDSIHPFWKKLDFVPSSSASQDVDTDAELEKITAWAKQTVKDSPQPVKRSLFHKLKEILKSGSNTKNPPVVVKNTRGRPTKKVQQERTEQAARVSSYTSSVQNEPEFSYDMPRHSSYVSGKTMTSSYSRNGELNNRYGKQIPKVFHPYISGINDVIPDGHCGFRCVSLALFDNQHRHLYIRNQLLKELEGNGSLWRRIFDREHEGLYDDLYKRIQFSGPGSASRANWMELPECGFLVANRFQIIVISVDIRGCSTVFPMNLGPVEYEEPLVAPIVYVNNGHFILLTLQGSYPMPPVDPRWAANRSDDAARWEDKYIDRIQDYTRRVFPRHDPNVTPDFVFL